MVLVSSVVGGDTVLTFFIEFPPGDLSDFDEGCDLPGFVILVIFPLWLAGACGGCCSIFFLLSLGIMGKGRILVLARAGVNLAKALRIFFFCFYFSLSPVDLGVVLADGVVARVGVAAKGDC